MEWRETRETETQRKWWILNITTWLRVCVREDNTGAFIASVGGPGPFAVATVPGVFATLKGAQLEALRLAGEMLGIAGGFITVAINRLERE